MASCTSSGSSSSSAATDNRSKIKKDHSFQHLKDVNGNEMCMGYFSSTASCHQHHSSSTIETKEKIRLSEATIQDERTPEDYLLQCHQKPLSSFDANQFEGTPTRIATAKQPMPHEMNTENNMVSMAEATNSLVLRANLIRSLQQYRTGFVFQ